MTTKQVNWIPSQLSRVSRRESLDALCKRVLELATDEPGYWASVERFSDVQFVKPRDAAGVIDGDMVGLTLTWPQGTLRADRDTSGEFWVAELELGKGERCMVAQSQLLVWGKAGQQEQGGTRFHDGRVKSFILPLTAAENQTAVVTATRVAEQADSGAWREVAIVLGPLVTRGA